MDSGIKQQWCDALRSGNYQQGKHSLRRTTQDGDLHCVLGVLCEVVGTTWHWANAEFWPEVSLYQNEWIADDGEGSRSTSDLPRGIAAKVGLGQHDRGDLLRLNDTGSSFAYLANHIEDRL